MSDTRNPVRPAGVRTDPGRRHDEPTGAGEVGAGEMSEEDIDRNLMGSFPASDPPSWTLGIGGPDAEAGDEVEDGYIEPEASETAGYGVKEQQSS